MTTYKKNMILFGIKSLLISNKNLITSLSITKNFEKQKYKLMAMKLQIFMIKKITKVDSNHSFLVVITLDAALIKGDIYYLQMFKKG